MSTGDPYQITLARPAAKEFASLPRDVQERIAPRIDGLAADPRPHDSKKIAGADNVYRIRIGDYRVLYSIFEEDDANVVCIVSVGHRKDVYRP